MKSYLKFDLAILIIIFSILFACTGGQVDDAILTARIKARMTADGRISPTRIDVDVLNGDVTLRGETPTQEEKDAAEEVARRVEGVRSVNNQIVVNPSADGTGIPSGEEMKRRAERTVGDVGRRVKEEAEEAFLLGQIRGRLVAAGYGAVAVDVERGVATLKGDVPREKDRIAVEAIVDKIKGIERVDNQLTVTRRAPAPKPSSRATPAPRT